MKFFCCLKKSSNISYQSFSLNIISFSSYLSICGFVLNLILPYQNVTHILTPFLLNIASVFGIYGPTLLFFNCFSLFYIIILHGSHPQFLGHSLMDFHYFFLGSISFVNVSLHPISIMNMFPPIVNYFPFYVFSNIFLSTYLLKNYQR